MAHSFISKIKKCLLAILLVTVLTLSVLSQSPSSSHKEKSGIQVKRIALVIGNGTYRHTTSLPNPVNDANDVSATLKELGFEVISGTNQTKKQIEDLIRQFGTRLADTKGVGLFFYAGHGISAGGVNYLVPVDADIQAEDEIEYASVSINFALGKMAAANNGFNMVLLDACRNNPFARKWRNYRDIGDKGGLARIDAPTGTLIAYATKPGDVAADGKGRNGLYTSALLKQMRVKNVEVGKMLQRVRADVISQSGGKQVPFDESSVVGDFYFAGLDPSSVLSNSNQSTVAPGEASFWRLVENSDEINDLEEYLSRVKSKEFVGAFSSLAESKLIRLRKSRSDIGWAKLSATARMLLQFDRVWWVSIDGIDHSFTVKLDGTYRGIDKAGKPVEPDTRPTLKKRGGLSLVQIGSKWGVVDGQGNQIVPPTYEFAIGFFENGLAAVKSDGRWGFIDEEGREVIPIRYDDVDYDIPQTWPFREGIAAVKLNNKWGFIDRTGHAVISFKYDGIWSYSFRMHGFYGVKLKGKKGFVDIYGNEYFDF